MIDVPPSFEIVTELRRLVEERHRQLSRPIQYVKAKIATCTIESDRIEMEKTFHSSLSWYDRASKLLTRIDEFERGKST